MDFWECIKHEGGGERAVAQKGKGEPEEKKSKPEFVARWIERKGKGEKAGN